MPLLRRTLLLAALVIQAAFGPAGLTLDVCHGRLQWAAPAGESCCGTDSHAEEAVASADESKASECGCRHDHASSRTGSPAETPKGPPREPVSLKQQDSCPTCYQVAMEGSDDAFEPRTPDLAPTLGICSIVEDARLPGAAQRLAVKCTSRAPPGAVRAAGLLPGTFPLRI